ncbi:SDR family oxidoreductase [Streptomyces sp. NPDC046909]|uniref:SDR family NAD(P)-dependent oxidoreductase n=1 Tax=Streptomyces sp. NPDC046909 TaxID=3155617 RepID=UPI0033DCC0A4
MSETPYAAGDGPEGGAVGMRGQVVLLTGGAKGLGRAFAHALGAAGARLFITGRDEAALDEAEKSLRADGVDVEAIAGDVSDPGTVRRTVARAERAAGGVDVVINNAAVTGPVGPTWQTDAGDWWRAMEVNLKGTLLVSGAALEFMTARRRGRIVNLVSHAGRYRWPHAAAYSVSKAAVIKLTENLARELRPHGVAVLDYDPGAVDIGMTRTALAGDLPPDDPWSAEMVRWARRTREAGKMVPLHRATGMLLRLAAGDADALSGRYISSVDDLDALLRGDPEASVT